MTMRRLHCVLFATILGTALLGQSVLAHEDRSGRRAVTLWWLFFNNPDGCVTNPGAVEQCGEIDVFGQAYLESVAGVSPDPGLISRNPEAKLGVVYATFGVTNSRARITAVPVYEDLMARIPDMTFPFSSLVRAKAFLED